MEKKHLFPYFRSLMDTGHETIGPVVPRHAVPRQKETP